MYICICNEITDTQIKQAVADGVGSFQDLQQQLGVAQQCGECKCHARNCMRECSRSCTTKYLPKSSETQIPVADIRT